MLLIMIHGLQHSTYSRRRYTATATARKLVREAVGTYVKSLSVVAVHRLEINFSVSRDRLGPTGVSDLISMCSQCPD